MIFGRPDRLTFDITLLNIMGRSYKNGCTYLSIMPEGINQHYPQKISILETDEYYSNLLYFQQVMLMLHKGLDSKSHDICHEINSWDR